MQTLCQKKWFWIAYTNSNTQYVDVTFGTKQRGKIDFEIINKKLNSQEITQLIAFPTISCATFKGQTCVQETTDMKIKAIISIVPRLILSCNIDNYD